MKKLFCSYVDPSYRNMVSTADFANVGRKLNSLNFRNANSSINGKVYLFNDWGNSGVVYFNNQELAVEKINFNIKENRLEILISDNSIYAVNPSDYDKVTIGNQEFLGNKNQNKIQEQLITFGDDTIFKEYTIKIKKGKVNPLTNLKVTEDKYYIAESYFKTSEKESTSGKISLNKKLVYSMIDNLKKDDIKLFVKKYKLSYTKEKDVLKILKHFNS